MARSLLQNSDDYHRNRIGSLTEQREQAIAKQLKLAHEAYLNPHEWGKGQMVPRKGRDAEQALGELQKTTQALDKTNEKIAFHQNALNELEASQHVDALVERHRQKDQDKDR